MKFDSDEVELSCDGGPDDKDRLLADAKRLAEEHWDSYIGELYKLASYPESEIGQLRFTYISAWVHGVKHVLEDMGVE